ncbi:MAG: 16S rRNA (guanine(966)-N(2))-methyltransferase RsmD [Cyanobium sp.]
MSLRLSGGRRLQSPPGDTARPTAARVRQAVLNLLGPQLQGCRWLDLCCGSGVMACEALQRGAAEVIAIDRDRRVAVVARANLQAVAAGMGEPPPRVQVIQADARRWLKAQARAAAGTAVKDIAAGGPEGPFDLIYCDPPWSEGLHIPLSEAVSAGGWLAPAGSLVWECPSDRVPEPPSGWQVRDQRRYGGSTVVLLQPL